MNKIGLSTIKPVLIACTQFAEPEENDFNVAGIPDSDLMRASFGYDLGMDSLDFMLFCLELERQLNVRVDIPFINANFNPNLTLAQFLDRVTA